MTILSHNIADHLFLRCRRSSLIAVSVLTPLIDLLPASSSMPEDVEHCLERHHPSYLIPDRLVILSHKPLITSTSEVLPTVSVHETAVHASKITFYI
ncbi:hypothetical protein EVAR_74814_1 [Eumeta japonica]|uniref:Uncharacterized protein n=1 Tax=Eumeta variegata TaxID=151549 RepID=A0A4C1SRV2_EUMVA|nr:hypothetical protein EVAR_74814_1 [Eumeta japonica]